MATVGRFGIGFGALSFSNDSISWRAKFAFVTLVLLWAYAFAATLQPMLQAGATSSFNQHSLFAIPLFIGLMLSKRAVFSRIAPQVSQLGLLLVFLFSAGWIFALISQIKWAEQLCVLALLPAIFMLAFGYKISKCYLFPLAYGFLLWPIGDVVIPAIQERLLTSVVQAFVYADLPVYWDTQSISTASYELNVAKFAESLQYLLIFFAAGCIYAHWQVTTTLRRLLVAVAFLVLPFVLMFVGICVVLRDGLTIAPAGISAHYGWIITAVALLLSVVIGVLLKQPKPYHDSLTALDWQSSWRYTDFKWLRPTMLAASVFILASSLANNVAQHADRRPNDGVLAALSKIKNWDGPVAINPKLWPQNFHDASKTNFNTYNTTNGRVQLFTAGYFSPTKLTNIIKPRDALYTNSAWQPMKVEQHTAHMANGNTLPVIETVLEHGTKHLLTWHWYWAGSMTTTNKFKFKLLDSVRLLGNMGDYVGVIAISTEVPADCQQGRKLLQQFVLDAGEQLMQLGARS